MKGRDAGHPHHHPKKGSGGRPHKSKSLVSETHRPDPTHQVSGNPSKPRLDKYARGGTIHIKPAHKGMLHADLGVKQGSKIPKSKLESAKHSSDPAERKRATFALNAAKWHH